MGRHRLPFGLRAARCCVFCAVVVAGSASASFLHAQEEPLPVEALVAIVGGETPQQGTDLVLLSDVELRARLDLGPSGPTVRPTRALLAATLDQIVGELLIAREGTRLHATEPREADVAAQRDRLVATLGGEARLVQLLSEMHATEAEIDVIARRRAYVDAFLRANLEGTTTVSDARVEEVFASGDHPFGSMPFETAREPLRAWLALRSLADDVARWVTVLRQRTVVRVLVPLGTAASEPEPSATARGESESAPPEESETDVAR